MEKVKSLQVFVILALPISTVLFEADVFLIFWLYIGFIAGLLWFTLTKPQNKIAQFILKLF